MDVGALLRQARHDACLSQVALARAAGVSRTGLSRWESGSVVPTLATVDRVLAACGRELRGHLVRRHTDLDALLDELAALSVGRRALGWSMVSPMWFDQIAGVSDVTVVTGGLSALAQGLPVERARGGLRVDDVPGALERVCEALRTCFPALWDRGEPTGVPFTPTQVRAEGGGCWWSRQLLFDLVLAGPDDPRPPTVALSLADPRDPVADSAPVRTVTVQAVHDLPDDGAVQPEVVARWLARAGVSPQP